MKELIESMRFTKKSIFPVFIITVGIMITICVKIGFIGINSIIISIISLSAIFFIFLGYTIYVICLYHKLPKNKSDNMGVLFYINAHKNSDDYTTITNKFCEKFQDMSKQIENNKLTPIILTEKQVSVIKNIYNPDIQHKLLKKTNCLFGVFMKSTDVGKESDEYELKMNAMLTHPRLNEILGKMLKNNFNCIFQGLHSNTLNKRSDLKDLQNLSTQLYFVCQLIFGVANEYCGYSLGALHLFQQIESKIKNEKSNFYNQLLTIVNHEICSSSILITTEQYNNFIYNNQYDVDVVKDTLEIMNKYLQIIKNDYYTINYHLSKAVYHLICGRITESKSEISLLSKNFSKIRPNQRVWAYSEAFLMAYENKQNKYKTLNEKYKYLKNNKTQDPSTIYYFIDAFLNKEPTNLGLKLALLLLTYYKKDELNCDILPKNIQDEVVCELNKLGQIQYSKFIKELKFK